MLTLDCAAKLLCLNSRPPKRELWPPEPRPSMKSLNEVLIIVVFYLKFIALLCRFSDFLSWLFCVAELCGDSRLASLLLTYDPIDTRPKMVLNRNATFWIFGLNTSNLQYYSSILSYVRMLSSAFQDSSIRDFAAMVSSSSSFFLINFPPPSPIYFLQETLTSPKPNDNQSFFVQSKHTSLQERTSLISVSSTLLGCILTLSLLVKHTRARISSLCISYNLLQATVSAQDG